MIHINLFEVTMETIQGCHPDEFEALVEQYYEALGYEVTRTPVTNDYGADLVVSTPAGNFAIQCKRQSSNVGIKAVQEVYASLRKYNATFGIVITSSSYTNSAIELAKMCGVKLINGNELWEMILAVKNNEFAIKNKIDFFNDFKELVDYRNNCVRKSAELDDKFADIVDVATKVNITSKKNLELHQSILESYDDITRISNDMKHLINNIPNADSKFNTFKKFNVFTLINIGFLWVMVMIIWKN